MQMQMQTRQSQTSRQVLRQVSRRAAAWLYQPFILIMTSSGLPITDCPVLIVDFKRIAHY